MRILGSVLAVAALCLLLAGNVSATSTGYVTMSFYNVSPRDTGWVSTSMGTTYVGVYNQKVYLHPDTWDDLLDSDGNGIPDQEASQFIDSIKVGAGGGSGKTQWAYAQTFCADFKQYASGSFLRYDIFRPEDAPVGGLNTPGGMGDPKAADLRRLWDQYKLYGLGTLTYTLNGTTYDTNETAAAFQASVWEIIYEASGTYDVKVDLNKGNFYVNGVNTLHDWRTLANDWLTDLDRTVDPDIGLRVLVNENQQDFSIVVPGIGRDPVPEPVTMAGLMIGIGGLSGYIRRRRRA